jgi:murein L,D-transpeptidase YafK
MVPSTFKRLVLISLLTLSYAQASNLQVPEFLPEVLIKLDPLFTHHVLVAEKSTHQLHLFENRDGYPILVRSFDVATGKMSGDKRVQGDHKTPEGIYRFTEFINHQELLERHGRDIGAIYGVGAFVMDYPNPIDRILGKTGGGIWLHSTNDETRIDMGLDSRGCIVSTNKDLIDISRYLEMQRSSVIVVQHLRYLPRENWERNRAQIEMRLGQWLDSWRALDLERYISFYDSSRYSEPNRPNFRAFKTHKRNVFRGTRDPLIEIDNISILASGLGAEDYLKVTFLQHYRSASLNDIGRKTLYLMRDENYDWNIVSELWSKHGLPEQALELPFRPVAFTPQMRYFTSHNPADILKVEYTERNQTRRVSEESRILR